ncbi:YczE/YyaS/YitT family protein [Bacillus massiliigorillae]|uniref:YczE/YyaS/YitT family protein n=1 Tax=Bacillus massiliigorillae TaxID=1243664 RepID=UPI00039A2CBD|nr:membrane protein [Bacillus massiliigorillae]
MSKWLRLLRLMFGLFLFALGSVCVMNSNLGYGPWELFQSGLTNLMPLTIGEATVLVSVVIVIIILLLKEIIGVGTLANMAFIGIFMDVILSTGVIPFGTGIISGFVLLFLGLFITAFGSYFYISSGFGAGPRDSLMVAIRRRTGLSIGMSRGILECSAATAGWLLGGPLGIGTVMTAILLGFCVQLVFRLFSFEATAIVHENLWTTLQIRGKSKS